MSARNARLIRIGIMSRCLPYEAAGSATVLDIVRLTVFADDYFTFRRNRLVQRSRVRTQTFTRTWARG